jgi:endoglycosylceramidase
MAMFSLPCATATLLLAMGALLVQPAAAQTTLKGGVSTTVTPGGNSSGGPTGGDVFSSGGGGRGNTTYRTGTQARQPNDAPCNNPFGCAHTYTNELNSGPGSVYCQQSPGMPMYGPYSHTGTQTPCNLPTGVPGPSPQPPQQTTTISGCWNNLPDGKLCVANGVFRERHGNVVILRGVNISGASKVPPFLPLPPLGALPAGTDCSSLPDGPTFDQCLAQTDYTQLLDRSSIQAAMRPLPYWGVNVLRLIFIWEAYEPIEGQRNASYLEMLRAIIREAWRHHIYTLLDFHEDAFARYLANKAFVSKGCGDGFPKWAIPPKASALGLATPDNTGGACLEWMGQAFKDPKVHLAFDGLYNSAKLSSGTVLRQKYIATIRDLVTSLGNEPGVIGIDALNEPFSQITGPGFGTNPDASGFTAPLDQLLPDLLTRGRVSDAQLTNLYQELSTTLAGVLRASHVILFLEPNLMIDLGMTSNLQRPRGNDQVVYAPHYYEPDMTAFFGTYLLPTRAQNAFQNMKQVAASWGGPLFLGEFGAVIDKGRVPQYIDLINELLNQTLASAAQWSFTPSWTNARKDGWNGEDLSIIANGQLRPALFRPRPYPQEISGTPQSLQVTYSTGGTPPGDTSLSLSGFLAPNARPYSMSLTWISQSTETNRTVFYLPQSFALSHAARTGANEGACLASVNPFGRASFQGMLANCLGQNGGGNVVSVTTSPQGAAGCQLETDRDGIVRLVCQVLSPGQQITVSIFYNDRGAQ